MLELAAMLENLRLFPSAVIGEVKDFIGIQQHWLIDLASVQ
jgi:hypothetical protein